MNQIPVGLSIEQQFGLAKAVAPVSSNPIEHDYLLNRTIHKIQTYLSKQEFKMPTQQLVDWDNMPNNAVSATVLIQVFDINKQEIVSTVLTEMNPNRKVYLGREYVSTVTGDKVCVLDYGQVKEDGQWVKSIIYRSDKGGRYTVTFDEFCKEFELAE